MSWIQRIGPARGRETAREDPEEVGGGALRRAAPGVAALFDGLRDDGGHVVLDLGPAAPTHLSLYRRFARQICFADVLPHPPRGRALTRALDELPLHPGQPYDVVLIWNILDRIGPEERRVLLDRLTEITASTARMYAVVEASDAATTRPLRFTLVDRSTVSQEPAGRTESAGHRLLPAEVERLVAPWEVVRAFTLRVGLREYVAVRSAATG